MLGLTQAAFMNHKCWHWEVKLAIVNTYFTSEYPGNWFWPNQKEYVKRNCGCLWVLLCQIYKASVRLRKPGPTLIPRVIFLISPLWGYPQSFGIQIFFPKSMIYAVHFFSLSVSVQSRLPGPTSNHIPLSILLSQSLQDQSVFIQQFWF